MDIKLTAAEKEKLLLRELSKKGAATANEIIDTIFHRDIRLSYGRPVERGWRFYVHLNKHFSNLKRGGLIVHKSMKPGPTGRMEKVWILSPRSIKKHFDKIDKKKNIKELVKKSLNRIKINFKKSKR